MNTSQGFTVLGIVIVCALLVMVSFIRSASAPEPTPSQSSSSSSNNPPATITAALGEEFTLTLNQTAAIDESLQLTVTEFINSPCPPNANCVWIGVGVGATLEFNGQTETTMYSNVGGAHATPFGFTVTITKTDFETAATFKVERE